MKLLITGICGFAGSTLACALQDQHRSGGPLTILGVDNLSRAGSEMNRHAFKRRGIKLYHGDLRLGTDFEALPAFDWVIDAAANPSVLARGGRQNQQPSNSGSQSLVHRERPGTLQAIQGRLHFVKYEPRLFHSGVGLISRLMFMAHRFSGVFFP